MSEVIFMRRAVQAGHLLSLLALAIGVEACSPGDDRAPVDAAPPAAACPGFTAVGDSSYLVLDEMLAWNDALARCQAYPGAHLVTFETAEEVAAVASALALPGPVWTGIEQTVTLASGFDLDDGWFNEIGRRYTEVPAGFPWAPGEPSDGVQPKPETGLEDCAELRADGTFNDAIREHPNRVLCECEPQ